MNSVAQKVLQEKYSALHNSVFFLSIMLSISHLWNPVYVLIRQRGPADTKAEMESNINDQENSKNDADFVKTRVNVENNPEKNNFMAHFYHLK